MAKRPPAKPIEGNPAKPIEGRLKKADFGYSLPVDQPLYQPFPFFYKTCTILTYEYVTDADEAAKVLPVQMTLDEEPKVRMIFATYPWSSLGFYNEIAQSLVCQYKGIEYTYAVRLHVTSDRAMAAGREIGGFPKKIGRIEFNVGAEYLSYLESPEGLRVCSGVMIPDKVTPDKMNPIEIPKGRPFPLKYISLRVMPNPTDRSNPSLCELLETVWNLGPGERWDGIGTLSLNGTSDLDPYHKLPVIKLLRSSIYRGDMEIGTIKVLERI